MHRSEKSWIKEERDLIQSIKQLIHHQNCHRKFLETKGETGKTKQIHSNDPMHSVNNVDEGMTHTRPLIPHVPFHPGPTYSPLPNLLDQMSQEVRKVHKVQPV